MADQGKIPAHVVRRRDALGLAGAVAAFGAALGMSTTAAQADTPKKDKMAGGQSQQIKVQSQQMKLQPAGDPSRLKNTAGQTRR